MAWTKAPRASFYQVQGYPLTPPYEGATPVLVNDLGEPSFSARLTGLAGDDTHEVAVTAFAPGYLAHGRGGSLVNVSTTRAEYVDVLPADIGAWLEGTVSFSSYQGQSGGSAWLSAFDGVTPVTNALVTANGEALSWDRQSQAYTGAVDVRPGERAAVAVTVTGRPRKAVEVALPGEFTVTRPPRSHPTRTPLALSWTSSPDATGYRVSVTDTAGRLLHFEALAGTSATVPALDATGEVFVTVAADRLGPGRHLVGLVQESFDVTLTP